MSIGFGQIIIILVVIFLIFGASRLPRIAEDVAKGMKAFKKGLLDEEEAETEKAFPKKTSAKKAVLKKTGVKSVASKPKAISTKARSKKPVTHV